jgi:hypothetical protein
MIARRSPAPEPSHRALRFAWWAAFLATVALLAAIGFARSAHAASPPALPGASAPIPPPFEDGEQCEADEPDCAEEELDEEECELGEDGEEECEGLDQEEGEAPPECLLTTARPRISVSAAQQRLRLDVRYTLAAPAEVNVGLRSSGGKGTVALAASKRHLSHSGNFHETAQLTEAETERALAAKQFTVRLQVLDVPGLCHRYDFRHLRLRHGGQQSPVFSETGAELRAGR